MGQAIPGEGFFYLDFEDSESDMEVDSNEAIISFTGVGLSIQDLEAELRHLVEAWDWRVRQIDPLQFSVTFPSRDLLTMSTRCGKLFLPLHDTEASIRLAESDPAPAVLLQQAWVSITGLPKRFRRKRRLMAGLRMLGRPLEVDESSLASRGPVRMRIECRDTSRLNGYAQIFHKSEGYNVGIRVDQPGVLPNAPPPPPPANDGSGEDSDEEWRVASERDRGRYGVGAQPPAGTQAAGGAPAAPSAPSSTPGATTNDAVAPDPLIPDQYGSLLRGSGSWPLPLSALERLRATEPVRAEAAPSPSRRLGSTGADKALAPLEELPPSPVPFVDADDSLGSLDSEGSQGAAAAADLDEVSQAAPPPAAAVAEAEGVATHRARKAPASGPPRKSARLQGPEAAMPSVERA